MVNRAKIKHFLRIASGVAFVIFAGGLESACRSATEITFLITTDEPCGSVKGTAISVGTLGAALDAKPPSTTSTFCDDQTHSLGSLVVVPSGDRDAEIAVRIVTGTKSTTDECIQNNFTGGCIVARRALHFIPHSPVTVPVSMQSACIDQVCAPDQTCNQGGCTKVVVDCSGAACGDDGNGDGGTTTPDGGPANPVGWRSMSASPLSVRTPDVAVAIGRTVFIWGGDSNGSFVKDGALYDPATDTWTMIDPGPLSERSGSVVGVSTDDQVVIWGGGLGGSGTTDGAVYKRESNTDKWTHLSGTASGLSEVSGEGAAFTTLTNELVIFGGNGGQLDNPSNVASAYSVPNGTWRYMGSASPLAGRTNPSMVTLPNGKIVVFGGLCANAQHTSNSPCTDYSIYDASQNSWTTPQQITAFTGRIWNVAVSVGTQALFWGGVSGYTGGTVYGDGAVLDTSGTAASLTAIAAPDPGVLTPTARWNAIGWSANDRMWIWGGSSGEATALTNTGAIYDPSTKAWSTMPSVGAPAARIGAAAVWTGKEEVIWGGWNADASSPVYLSDGVTFTP